MALYRVGIVGPESTGKSILSAYLARRYDGVLIPEYAREYMESLAPWYNYTYEDVLSIAQRQIQQLSNPLQCTEITDHSTELIPVFYDTELIITKVWLEHKYGYCPDFIIEAIKQYPMDVYLLCYPDLPWMPDPVRENPNIRDYLFDWYEREIQNLSIPYYVIKHQ